MASDEGLNAYGAVTLGPFFVYQGFNDRAGWMHTSSGVNAITEYLETVEKKGDKFYYSRAGGSTSNHASDRDSLQILSGNGRKEVHRVPHASRPHHPRARRASA